LGRTAYGRQNGADVPFVYLQDLAESHNSIAQLKLIAIVTWHRVVQNVLLVAQHSNQPLLREDLEIPCPYAKCHPSLDESPFFRQDVQVFQEQYSGGSHVDDNDRTSLNDSIEASVLESDSDSDTSSLFGHFSHHGLSEETQIGDFDYDSDESSHLLGEEDGISVEHLQDDPLFIRNATLFDPYQLGMSDECVDDEVQDSPDIPYGLTVHPSI
jgi:hypothetical protein